MTRTSSRKNSKTNRKSVQAKTNSSSSALAGLTFCMTGTMSVSRSEMEGFIQANGGDVVKSVTKKCTHLISTETGTKKCTDAEKKGAVVVSETWVREQCDLNGGSMEEDEDEKEEDMLEVEDNESKADRPADTHDEAPPASIVDFYRTSPLSRYVDGLGDSSCLFLEENGIIVKFWKFTLCIGPSKSSYTTLSGLIGTEGTTEEVECESASATIRAMSNARNALIFDEDGGAEKEFWTFESYYNHLKDVWKQKAKKLIDFPQLTAKFVHSCENSASKSVASAWLPVIQDFLSSYEYINNDGQFYLDFSSKDVLKWKWYEAYEECDAYDEKEQRKEHKALVKKDAYAKKISKQCPTKLLTTPPNSGVDIDYAIFELSIDGVKYYLLTAAMCVNDPQGHYNVLFDSKKKEIFRIEVHDTIDPSVDDDGVWKTTAMKKIYESLLQRIELFMVNGQMLGTCCDFTFNWEDENVE